MLQEIMIPLGGGTHDTPRLEAGQALAGLFPMAQVVAVLAQPSPADSMVWSPDGLLGGYPVEVMAAMAQSAHESLMACREQCVDYPDVTFEHLTGQPERVLGERAALADLVVVDCASARNEGPLAAVFDQLLLAARVPLLVQRRPVADLSGTAVVAWDGSPPAARAFRAALPLLAAMKHVYVAQSPGGLEDRRKPFAEPARLVGRIAAAGGQAEAVNFSSGSNVAADLIRLADDAGAGLLVCGAYGHSRLGEFVLGGTSRDLIANPSSPSLLLHH